jgi:myo-inositol 2-dehydrogenase/D-chiro-inositol 1-dehydrogenase
MSKKNLRIGVIGAGRIGIVHSGSVNDTAGAELVVVVDAIEESAAKLAGQYGDKHTTNIDDIFTKGDVDAIIVGSPTPTHVDLINRSIDAGIHVLCEKPVDLDINRANTIKDKVANSKTNVSIAFNRRYDPNFAAVYARVKAGELGNLEQLVLTSRDPAPPPQAYIAVSGGIFRDQVIHDFDIARYFVGDIAEVSTFATNAFSSEIKAEGDFDTAITNLRSTDGKLVSIINSRHSSYGYDQRLEAFGDKGMLQVTNIAPTSVRSFKADHSEQLDPYLDFFLERYAASYRKELALFIESIETGKQLNPTYEDGCKALILADAATESAKTGKVVKVIKL